MSATERLYLHGIIGVLFGIILTVMGWFLSGLHQDVKQLREETIPMLKSDVRHLQMQFPGAGSPSQAVTATGLPAQVSDIQVQLSRFAMSGDNPIKLSATQEEKGKYDAASSSRLKLD